MANKYQKIMEMLEASPTVGTIKPLGHISEEELNDIEMQIGYALPDDFREFMRDYAAYNFMGEYPLIEDGRPDVRNIDGFVGKEIARGYFATIECLKDDSDNKEFYPGLALLRHLSEESEKIGWPPELLTIGYDGGGNQICLALFGLHTGAIFYWRANPYPNSQNLYLIADSFDEFIHLLRKDE